MLGANDRKMQRSSSSNAGSKLFVAPRDHFLDNAGMSESESDSDLIEEGMLIEAPVTPEKSPPAINLEGEAVPVTRQQAASQEGREEAPGVGELQAGALLPQGSGEGDGGAGGQACSMLETGRHDEAMDREKGMGSIPTVPSASQVLPSSISLASFYDRGPL